MPIIFLLTYKRFLHMFVFVIQNKYFDVFKTAFIILSLRHGPDLSCVVTEHFQIYYMLFYYVINYYLTFFI